MKVTRGEREADERAELDDARDKRRNWIADNIGFTLPHIPHAHVRDVMLAALCFMESDPDFNDVSTIEILAAAAEAYGEACDAGNYPALSRLARELKEAARKYRWSRAGIASDPRPEGARGAR